MYNPNNPVNFGASVDFEEDQGPPSPIASEASSTATAAPGGIDSFAAQSGIGYGSGAPNPNLNTNPYSYQDYDAYNSNNYQFPQVSHDTSFTYSNSNSQPLSPLSPTDFSLTNIPASTQFSASYAWQIENYLHQFDEKIVSPTFGHERFRWQLVAYSKGVGEGKDSHLGVFLRPLKNSKEDSLGENWSRGIINFTIAIWKDGLQMATETSAESFTGFNNSCPGWGFQQLLPLDSIQESLSYDGTLTIQAEVTWSENLDTTSISSSWAVSQFSAHQQHSLSSEFPLQPLISHVFGPDHMKWQVHLYPTGKDVGKRFVSLFVIAIPSAEEQNDPNWTRNITGFSIRIRNGHSSLPYDYFYGKTLTGGTKFSQSSLSCGWTKYLDTHKILDALNSQGDLFIETEISWDETCQQSSLVSDNMQSTLQRGAGDTALQARLNELEGLLNERDLMLSEQGIQLSNLQNSLENAQLLVTKKEFEVDSLNNTLANASSEIEQLKLKLSEVEKREELATLDAGRLSAKLTSTLTDMDDLKIQAAESENLRTALENASLTIKEFKDYSAENVRIRKIALDTKARLAKIRLFMESSPEVSITLAEALKDEEAIHEVVSEVEERLIPAPSTKELEVSNEPSESPAKESDQTNEGWELDLELSDVEGTDESNENQNCVQILSKSTSTYIPDERIKQYRSQMYLLIQQLAQAQAELVSLKGNQEQLQAKLANESIRSAGIEVIETDNELVDAPPPELKVVLENLRTDIAAAKVTLHNMNQKELRVEDDTRTDRASACAEISMAMAELDCSKAAMFEALNLFEAKSSSDLDYLSEKDRILNDLYAVQSQIIFTRASLDDKEDALKVFGSILNLLVPEEHNRMIPSAEMENLISEVEYLRAELQTSQSKIKAFKQVMGEMGYTGTSTAVPTALASPMTGYTSLHPNPLHYARPSSNDFHQQYQQQPQEWYGYDQYGQQMPPSDNFQYDEYGQPLTQSNYGQYDTYNQSGYGQFDEYGNPIAQSSGQLHSNHQSQWQNQPEDMNHSLEAPQQQNELPDVDLFSIGTEIPKESEINSSSLQVMDDPEAVNPAPLSLEAPASLQNNNNSVPEENIEGGESITANGPRLSETSAPPMDGPPGTSSLGPPPSGPPVMGSGGMRNRKTQNRLPPPPQTGVFSRPAEENEVPKKQPTVSNVDSGLQTAEPEKWDLSDNNSGFQFAPAILRFLKYLSSTSIIILILAGLSATSLYATCRQLPAAELNLLHYRSPSGAYQSFNTLFAPSSVLKLITPSGAHQYVDETCTDHILPAWVKLKEAYEHSGGPKWILEMSDVVLMEAMKQSVKVGGKVIVGGQKALKKYYKSSNPIGSMPKKIEEIDEKLGNEEWRSLSQSSSISDEPASRSSYHTSTYTPVQEQSPYYSHVEQESVPIEEYPSDNIEQISVSAPDQIYHDVSPEAVYETHSQQTENHEYVGEYSSHANEEPSYQSHATEESPYQSPDSTPESIHIPVDNEPIPEEGSSHAAIVDNNLEKDVRLSENEADLEVTEKNTVAKEPDVRDGEFENLAVGNSEGLEDVNIAIQYEQAAQQQQIVESSISNDNEQTDHFSPVSHDEQLHNESPVLSDEQSNQESHDEQPQPHEESHVSNSEQSRQESSVSNDEQSRQESPVVSEDQLNYTQTDSNGEQTIHESHQIVAGVAEEMVQGYFDGAEKVFQEEVEIVTETVEIEMENLDGM
ncbi:hypothetical protein HK098_003907 [Nowakowskiella sp. JEL0407]|nr:hypothetical protein HK098_003907 [Nowakowskiella sp. JEL0407]